ncbi:helix-turn-helix transcriptional regulator [Aeromonas bestiarum]|uniref:AraC family transcriptional regulator n=1 Tax=Aeromonas bestiarum TaxID=105751 RepID=A0AAW7HUZ0_9GAMM|nr:AraC family transcriptional regulator [Aeromonas bestiarum]MDM5071395.1 AraC family transcriptional regulator [Aeromonas bestiarum]MDM5139599.1 AraC family transcriptional regulator [Aeromonas bestiarum]WDL83838.1 helix-turn-helix transcriptional regulator [Aeromonas bestiarum]
MLAIPVPFVVSLLLVLLAVILYVRLADQAKAACLFLALCAATTGLVGLRWTFDVALFSMAQPLLASLIPVAAWLIFTHAATDTHRVAYHHVAGPILVAVSLFTHPFLALPLDGIITAIYLFYGIALVRYSAKEPLLIHVSFSHWEAVKRAEQVAGWMLLCSAMIDAAISLDLAVNQGGYSLYILTLAHLVLLPVLAIAVIMVSVNTPAVDDIAQPEIPMAPSSESLLTQERADEIVARVDRLMREKASYLDPDLTLAALSRKLGIPAKQISMAVNQVHQKSISRVVNEYRIEHAKQALLTTDETITHILMNAGFQTKSNFNREFSRIAGLTPSAFRKQSEARLR